MLNRSDIIEKMCDLYPNLSKLMVERIIKNILSYMSEQIAQNNRIEVRGFGAFSLKTRNIKAIRNPKSGAEIASTGLSYFIYFRAGKNFKARIIDSEATIL